VEIKGRIVEADPRETGTERALLNLGHTFAHALESAAGLGKISHGEAVAWGLVRSCELGFSLRITPEERAREICGLVRAYGYETAAPHPLAAGPSFTQALMQALGGDKKKRGGKLNFVIPAARGALLIEASPELDRLLPPLMNGELTL
jgi:3-dehydroquinate synthase